MYNIRPFTVGTYEQAPTNPRLYSSEVTVACNKLGASGDLAKKKTYPALFALFSNNLLPPKTIIYGYARSEMTDAKFRETMEPKYIFER